MKQEIIEKWKITRKLEGNPNWKGDTVKVHPLHSWINDNFVKTNICEHCSKYKKTEWSNKFHTYSRLREEWQEICRGCHLKYDFKMGFRTNKTIKLNGKWSRKYDACINCGEKEKPHRMNGLCRYCVFKKHGM